MSSLRQLLKQDENSYVSHVGAAIREHASTRGYGLPRYETAQGQGFWSVNKRPYDMVVQFSRFRVMLFEAKLINYPTLRIRAFDIRQHSHLTALRDGGIPISYLYPEQFEWSGAEERIILENSCFVDPKRFCRFLESAAYLDKNEDHHVLYDLLDGFLSGDSATDDALLMFLDPQLCAALSTLTMGVLIVMADLAERQAYVLRPSDLYRIVQQISPLFVTERQSPTDPLRDDTNHVAARFRRALSKAQALVRRINDNAQTIAVRPLPDDDVKPKRSQGMRP